jgi:hypothetical protein
MRKQKPGPIATLRFWTKLQNGEQINFCSPFFIFLKGDTMDDSLVIIPGNIVLIISNQKEGIYAFVDDAVADVKPNWWRVTFQILLPTPDFKPLKKMWILDNQQIHGQEFTMGGVKYQLQKTDLKLANQPSQHQTTSKIPEFEIKKRKRDIPSYLKLVK